MTDSAVSLVAALVAAVAAIVAGVGGVLLGSRHGSRSAATQAATDQRWVNARWAADHASESDPRKVRLGIAQLLAMSKRFHDDPELRTFINTSLEVVASPGSKTYSGSGGSAVDPTPLPPVRPVGEGAP